MNLWQVQYSYLIPLLPLFGAVIAGFFGAKGLKKQSHWAIWIGVGASAVIAISLLVQLLGMSVADGQYLAFIDHWYTWIHAGTFVADAGFLCDPLSAVMLTVVTGIGFLIMVYSKGYMAGEEGYFRFFAYLGLFIFSMCCLVMADNFVMLYLGWEGVGLCSYLLIGYYFQKPAPREAAKKAFIVNRIGDWGFSIGVMLCFFAFGTISFYGKGAGTNTGVLELAMSSHLTSFQQHCMYWIPFCLMLGAFGKSAQIPLYVWLPDAMEGPTPVSALMHAATMVTAGVYMIVRCSTLFVGNPTAMLTIGVVGCATAFFTATIAMRQFDLKKIWAYSTISQLGYMFCGIAALTPVAGIFHLVTHAFFKATLFLTAGVVMHAMAGELDIRRFSGLKRMLPKTRWCMLAGCFALAGFFPFSGFWSKDDIIANSFEHFPVIGVILEITAFLTAYYTFRAYFRTMEGPEMIPAAPALAHGHGHEPDARAAASTAAMHTGTAPASGVDVAQTHHNPGHGGHDSHGHNHEPPSMMLPVIILAIGAVATGLFCMPFDIFGIPANAMGTFLGHSPSFINALKIAHRTFGEVAAVPFGAHQYEAPHVTMMVVSGLVSFAGVVCAWLMHLKYRGASEALAAKLRPIATLLQGKYFVDEIYQAGVVESLRTFSRFLAAFDKWLVDGIVNTLGFIPRISGFVAQLTTQRGFLQGYAVTMLLGFVVILAVIFLR